MAWRNGENKAWGRLLALCNFCDKVKALMSKLCSDSCYAGGEFVATPATTNPGKSLDSGGAEQSGPGTTTCQRGIVLVVDCGRV